jgi:hypothetical protein
MQNFKEFLKESKSRKFAPWHMKDPDEIESYIRAQLDPKSIDNDLFFGSKTMSVNQFGYAINKDGTVSIKPDSHNADYDYKVFVDDQRKIPFKYKRVQPESRSIEIKDIDNLWGSPDTVVNSQLTIDSPFLNSLEHLNCNIGLLGLYINCSNLKQWNCEVQTQRLSIRNIHESLGFKDISKYFSSIYYCIVSDLLVDRLDNKGILGLAKLSEKTKVKLTAATGSKLANAFDVLNTLNTKDIIDAQEALIEAGFKEYAKL